MNNTSQSIQIKVNIHTIPISPVSYLRKPSPLPFSCISFSETPNQSLSIIYSILRVLSFLSLLLQGVEKIKGAWEWGWCSYMNLLSNPPPTPPVCSL